MQVLPPHDRRMTFDAVAHAYDASRPGYPAQLVEDVLAFADLQPGASMLEIGCGSGQATLPFAARGHDLVCVEIGEHLAELARAKLVGAPNARVVTAEFETWVPDAGPFALVYAATSWRWIDPDARLAKAARLLVPGGTLAVFSSTHTFPAGETDEFFHQIQDVYDSVGESRAAWPPPAPEKVPGHSHEIASSGWFGDVEQRRYVWETRYAADEYLALLDTFPDHLAMEPSVRRKLYGELRKRIAKRPGRQVRRHWVTVLDVARRLGPSA